MDTHTEEDGGHTHTRTVVLDDLIFHFYAFLKNFGLKLKKTLYLLLFFPNFDLILNLKNQRHAFIFNQNDLKFFV